MGRDEEFEKRKKRILIIDDEAEFTEMVKLNLETTGWYEVKVENHSKHAIATTLDYKPHLILLDIIMPEIEGSDVFCDIRSHRTACEIPVIFLTATVTKDEVNELDGMIGGHIFLAKPTAISELIECIQRQLE